MVERVVFENQCEPYTETTCYTQNKESCVPRLFNNCTGVIETKIECVYDETCTNPVELNCKRDKSTKNDGSGPKSVVCSRKPTQSCYNIPRKIQLEACKTDVHRY